MMLIYRVGLWETVRDFEKFYAKFQYLDTDFWDEEVPLLKADPDKEQPHVEAGGTICVRDIEAPMPESYVVEANNYGQWAEMERKGRRRVERMPWHPNDEVYRNAGACHWCKVSLFTVNLQGRPSKNGYMWALYYLKDGEYKAWKKQGGGNAHGKWLPCVCVKTKEAYDNRGKAAPQANKKGEWM
tara:strand:+ start:4148 stop:4702 length:555 start_codon:yes stop_codon:yes gene_type:complete